MYYAFIIFVVLIATIIGAIAGIGGGVIIRPALDAFDYFTLAEITNMISTIIVLVGAITSVITHIISKSKIEKYNIAIFLGIGSAIGGAVGQILFTYVKSAFNNDVLIIVQSAILIVLLIFVLIYMKIFLPKGKQLAITNRIITLLIGFGLGLFSSFLGIGGGPINVAILILFFGMDMKQAAINSLITIVFAQLAKIIVASFDGTFATLINTSAMNSVDQSWWIFLLILLPVSIIGSLSGSFLRKKMSNRTVEIVYNITTVAIIFINIYLIINASINLAG